MPMTIPEYANSRHISRQAVDKVLKKRADIDQHTFMGKSNGKDAKFLDDDAIGMLDQSIKMPHSNVEEVSKELTLFYTEEENKLLKAQNIIRDKLEGVQEELKEEVKSTRTELLESSREQHKAILERMDELKGNEITKEDIAELKEQLAQAQKRIEELVTTIGVVNQENADLHQKVLDLTAENSDLKADRKILTKETESYSKTIFGLYKKS